MQGMDSACTPQLIKCNLSVLQASATRASVWRADMCLREWERLLATGLVGHVGQPELAKVGLVLQHS
jgi:hypothetical protein